MDGVQVVVFRDLLGHITVPDGLVLAAGGLMPNWRLHWRTARRLEVWADWMQECELQQYSAHA